MLVKANEIDHIAVDNGNTNDEVGSDRETKGEEEPSSLMPKNPDGSSHPHGTVNNEGVFNYILNELRSLKFEILRKKILNLKHRDAFQCLRDQVQSLKNDVQKILFKKTNNFVNKHQLIYIMSDLNAKVKDVENEKSSPSAETYKHQGKNTSDQMVLNPTVSKKSIINLVTHRAGMLPGRKR